MGFFSDIFTAGRKLWHGIKKTVSGGYHWLKSGIKKVGRAGSWIDSQLNKLHQVPVLGELATLIQADPIYQGIAAGYNEINRIVDLAGEVGRDIGRGVDAVIGGGAGFDSRSAVQPSISPVGGLVSSNVLAERSVPNRTPLSGSGISSFAIA